MSASSTKWTFWRVLIGIMALVVFLGMTVFLSMTLTQYFKTPEQLWNASTPVFILIGVLLAVGVAFALLAMAISYLSLNDKLQQAHSYLAQARLHLDEYKQHSREEHHIQQKVYELVRHYDTLPLHAHTSEIHYLNTLIKHITTSEFADFEARLIARAVQKDWQAKQSFQAAQSQETELAWQHTIHQLQEAAFLWQSIKLASPEFLQLGQQKRFLATQFHQAQAWQALAQLNGLYKQPEYYRQLHALYQPLLLSEPSHDEALNQMLNDAAYQSGIQTYQEGEWLWQQSPHNLAQVRRKWADAQQAFAKALSIYPKDSESAAQWGHLLEREARLVAQSDAKKLPEARQLWLAAREKYRMVLDIDSQRADAAFNWGNTLSDEATALIQTSPEQLDKARFLWQSAREKYEHALEIQPQFDHASHQIGMTFNKEADAVLHLQQNTDEARYLWKSAGAAFQLALDRNPARFETVNSWGLVLAKEADLLAQLNDIHLPEAVRLWQLAQQRFHRALELEPSLQAASANWRTILSHELNVLDDDEQHTLLQNTYDKVLSLQHISPEHQQSTVIQDLANYIQKLLSQYVDDDDNDVEDDDDDEVDDEEQNDILQPPAFRPFTRNENI